MDTESTASLSEQHRGSSPTRAVVSLLLAAGLGAGVAWVGLMIVKPFDESADVSVDPTTVGPSDESAMLGGFRETASMEPIVGITVPPDAAVVPAPIGSRLLMCSPGQGGHVISYLPNPGVFISVTDWAVQLQEAGWQPVRDELVEAPEEEISFFSRGDRHCMIYVSGGRDPRQQVAVVWVESAT